MTTTKGARATRTSSVSARSAEPPDACKLARAYGPPEGKAFGGDSTAKVKRMTASEREALMRLNVAFEIMALDVLEPLAERMKMIPGARRDLAMMAKRITKIIEAVPGTIPDNQLRTYLNNLKMVSYTIGVRNPGKLQRDEKNYGMWLSFETLTALLAGCHDHCLMCHEDKAQRRACALRQALDAIPNDTIDREDGDCPYYTLL